MALHKMCWNKGFLCLLHSPYTRIYKGQRKPIFWHILRSFNKHFNDALNQKTASFYGNTWKAKSPESETNTYFWWPGAWWRVEVKSHGKFGVYIIIVYVIHIWILMITKNIKLLILISTPTFMGRNFCRIEVYLQFEMTLKKAILTNQRMHTLK